MNQEILTDKRFGYSRLENELNRIDNSRLPSEDKIDAVAKIFVNRSENGVWNYSNGLKVVCNTCRPKGTIEKDSPLDKSIHNFLKELGKNMDCVEAFCSQRNIEEKYLSLIEDHPELLSRNRKFTSSLLLNKEIEYPGNSSIMSFFDDIGRKESHKVFRMLLDQKEPKWKTTYMTIDMLKYSSNGFMDNNNIKQYINLLNLVEQKAEFFIQRGHDVLLKQYLYSKYPSDNRMQEGHKNLLRKIGNGPTYFLDSSRVCLDSLEYQNYGNLGRINDVLNTMDSVPAEDKQKFLELVSKGRNYLKRQGFLHDFLIKNGSSDLSDYLEKNVFKDFFTRKSLQEIVKFFSKDIDNFSFQMGIMLAHLEYEKLPLEVQDTLKPNKVYGDNKLKPYFSKWWLCDSAEHKLLNSMANNTAMLVNEALLIKFTGRFSALCTKTFTNNEGFTFIEGNWYAPINEEFRIELKDAFERGCAKVNIDKNSEWALIRASVPCGQIGKSSLLLMARKYTELQPEQFKVSEKIRRAYRMSSIESY